MKPKWADAPEWANALAMNADGTWVWCEKKPMPKLPNNHIFIDYWYTDGRSATAGKTDWRDTLEERPK